MIDKTNMRISVIGTGHLGSIHAKLLADNPDVTLAGLYDADIDKAKQKATELQTSYFEDIEQALLNSDAVVIATPTSLHHSIAVHCINEGKHCLIEKPITHTYDEALDVINRATQNGVIVQVGHVERFNPAFVAAKKYNLNPRFIEAHRLSQFKVRATDVSVIHDLMIHDIDIALWLTQSEAVTINAHGVAVLTETADLANARVEFENGCVANFTASRISASPMRKMRIFQKSGYVSLDFAKPSIDVYRVLNQDESSTEGVPAMMLGNIDSGTVSRNIVFEKPDVPQLNAIVEEHKSFISSIVHKTPVSVTAQSAAEALRIASRISTIVEQRTETM